MIAEILSVGTELLMGQIVNTDAQYIAERLVPLGFRVLYQVTVGDHPARLTEAVHTAFSRADVLICTGGLGPTDDDLTKETVAAALGMECVENAAELQRLTDYFRRTGRTMPPNNRKQICFPPSAVILPNPNGTAPGCILEKDGKIAVLMPGPPRELFPMFTNHVMPYLEKRSGATLYSRELRIFGMGESDVTYRLRDLIEQQQNPTIASYVKTGEVTLRVTALAESVQAGEKLAAPVIEQITARLGSLVFSTHGESMHEIIARILTEREQTLAVAESCTGGLIASTLVDLPGCSTFFLEGCVTYSNAAKLRRLGVSEATLASDGAVSEACARQMAEGMRKSACADYALATTGIAGPGGAAPDKPVGLVYVALAHAGGTEVQCLHLRGDRTRIRYVAMLNGFRILLNQLL